MNATASYRPAHCPLHGDSVGCPSSCEAELAELEETNRAAGFLEEDLNTMAPGEARTLRGVAFNAFISIQQGPRNPRTHTWQAVYAYVERRWGIACNYGPTA